MKLVIYQKNINVLSNKLHSHIGQLEQDIEKERKLENTRKEFISGVSHELKNTTQYYEKLYFYFKRWSS